MRTDKRSLQFAGGILWRCTAVGVLFAAAAHFLKHADYAVMLALFLAPIAVGAVLAGVVVFASDAALPVVLGPLRLKTECPHCGAKLASWRRFVMPARMRCASCGRLSAVRIPGKVALLALLVMVPLLMLARWAIRYDSTPMLVVAGGFTLVICVFVSAFGPLAPRRSYDNVQALIEEGRALRTTRWSPGFLVALVLLGVLIIAAIVVRQHG